MFASLDDDTIRKAANMLLRIKDQIKFRKNTEIWIQGVLFGIFLAIKGDMRIEHGVHGGRIDFRFCGPHPSLIELVTRRRDSYPVEHQARRNHSELLKLASIPYSRARKRILLILDFNDKRVDETGLYDGYQKEWDLVCQEVKLVRKLELASGITVLYFHSSISEPYRIVLATKKFK